MAGMLRRGMSWLGLGDDEEYIEDEYDLEYDEADEIVDVTTNRAVAPAQNSVVRAMPTAQRAERAEPAPAREVAHESTGSVRIMPSSPTPVRPRGGVAVAPEPIRPRSVVRPVPASASTRPHVVTPKTFNDAQEVGDWFRKGQPVILNLQDLERDLARRLLDFSSGVSYGLSGTVERVASHVYLLTPPDVEISSDDRRRLRERGLVED